MSAHALVFGASGVIGGEIASRMVAEGVRVTGVSRRAGAAMPMDVRPIAFDPLDPAADWSKLAGEPFDRVVWAQGANHNDSVQDFDHAAFEGLMQANVSFVLVSLSELLRQGRLARPARLCVVSSIWQALARPGKLSYSVTKAALQGLVRASAADLGGEGILINSVLPGVLETRMTKAMLSPEQIGRVEASTTFGRLPQVADVAEMVGFLCSERNTSITGQSIAVDLGFSHVRIV